MKRISVVLTVLCLCAFSIQAFAADMAPSVDKLSAHEKSLWEAIKNGDMKTFSAGTAEDLLDLDASGVAYNKKQAMDIFTQMKMTDYSLSDFSVTMLDKDCAVLTYKSTFTASMEGKTMTMKVLNSTTYVSHGGTWLPRFHTETVIPEMMMK
jgi:hypothetical protein